MNKSQVEQLLIDLRACDEARLWAKGKTLAEIWEQCERADWLLWLGGRMCGKDGWLDRKAIVSIACDCAELALPYVNAGDGRPRLAIEITRAWIRGEATIDQVKNARADAAYAAYAAAAYAADAAAYIADAAAYAAAAADAAAHAAYAAYVAYAAYAAAADAQKEMQAKCLAIVKAKLMPEYLLNG